MSIARMQQALKKRAESQAEVQFILTETRKLLEELNLRDRYRELAFFCDWTVHPKLSRSKVIKPIITEFTTAIDEVMKVRSTAPITDHIKKMISLDLLREELCKFLTSQSLSTELCKNDAAWSLFVVLYILIVSESPLHLSSGNELRLRCRQIGPHPKYPERRTIHVTEWVVTRNGLEIGSIGNEGYVQTVTETIKMDASGKITRTTKVH